MVTTTKSRSSDSELDGARPYLVLATRKIIASYSEKSSFLIPMFYVLKIGSASEKINLILSVKEIRVIINTDLHTTSQSFPSLNPFLTLPLFSFFHHR